VSVAYGTLWVSYELEDEVEMRFEQLERDVTKDLQRRGAKTVTLERMRNDREYIELVVVGRSG
jgi:hypothetical protein